MKNTQLYDLIPWNVDLAKLVCQSYDVTPYSELIPCRSKTKFAIDILFPEAKESYTDDCFYDHRSSKCIFGLIPENAYTDPAAATNEELYLTMFLSELFSLYLQFIGYYLMRNRIDGIDNLAGEPTNEDYMIAEECMNLSATYMRIAVKVREYLYIN